MKFVVSIVALSLIFAISGCGKKEAQEEALEPVTMDVLTTLNTQADTQATAETTQVAAAPTGTKAQLAPLPPQGPYKPTARQIQAALKSAGFYAGEIDGNIGPISKKAIEEFQKANGLQADGKVGPKTWAALSKYLALKNE